MSTTSMQALHERLKVGEKADQEKISKTIKDERKMLLASLRKRSVADLNTIKDAMDQELDSFRKIISHSGLKTLVLTTLICLGVSLGLGLGSYGMMTFIGSRVTKKIEELDELNAQYQNLTANLTRQRRALGLFNEPVKVSSNGKQLWLNVQPELFQASDGTWVIQVK